MSGQIIAAETLTDGATLTCDVCVVGSGAGGATAWGAGTGAGACVFGAAGAGACADCWIRLWRTSVETRRIRRSDWKMAYPS